MIIIALPSGPFKTNAYILGCSKTMTAAIVDPGVDSAKKITQALQDNKLTPIKILLTHSHWDHIGDVAQLKKTFNLPVYIHKLDEPNLKQPGTDGLPMWTTIEAADATNFFDEGDIFNVGKISFKVIHTPGHTPGGVCFYSNEEGVLISGDTLFKQSIGNISFPTAQPELMWKSLKKLDNLPPETKVYPGHGATTTIGDESWLPDAKKLFGD